MNEPKIKITFEKENEETTYSRVTETHVFLVNGKKVHVYHWYLNDSQSGDYDGGTDIDEDDRESLTDDEYDAFSDEVDDLIKEDVGFKTEVNY